MVDRERCLEAAMSNRTLISIVDDDDPYRESMRKLIMLLGYTVEAFPSAADFLASRLLPETACLIADVHMRRMTSIRAAQAFGRCRIRDPDDPRYRVRR